jgi:hypothetical protein
VRLVERELEPELVVAGLQAERERSLVGVMAAV